MTITGPNVKNSILVPASKKSYDQKVLNYIFRHYSLSILENEQNFELEDQIEIELKKEFRLDSGYIFGHIKKTLRKIYYLNQFFRNYHFTWYPKPEILYRKTKIYLYKIVKIAPIFDYKRGKENLKNLQKLFFRMGFCPHITTQLALTIFITDLKSGESKKNNFTPIIQRNIRTLTSCSAYAFHRSRNKINKILKSNF